MKIAHLLSMGFVATSALMACSSNSAPCQGKERCNCYPNATCNAGLICASNLCVLVPDGAVAIEPGDGAGGGEEAGNDATSTDEGTAPPADVSSPTGPNLITNGDFSQGESGWDVVYGPGSAMVTGGELCVSGATTLTILGWPEPSGTTGIALTPAPYTLVYSARVQGGTTTVGIDAKVGQTVPPNNADFETPMNAPDNATATAATFTHTFTPPSADGSAGLAFSFTASGESVCFQNVRLIQN